MRKRLGRKAKKQPTSSPIRMETIGLIHINEVDGSLSFADVGDKNGKIKWSHDTVLNTVGLAHKFNQLAFELHKLQRITFTNNKMLAELLEQKHEQSKTNQPS